MVQQEGGQDADLAGRLAFIGLDAEAARTLRSLRPFLDEAVAPVLADFYAKVVANPALAAAFRGADGVERARQRQMQHWKAMADGLDRPEHLERVTRIGEVHARIGLETRWFVGGYALILAGLIERLIQARLAGGGRFWSATAKPDPARIAAEAGAIIRAALLDIDLIISACLARIDEKRRSAEEDRAKRQAAQERVLGELGRVLGAVRSGDLTARVGESMPYGFRPMAETLDQALESLAESFARVRGISSGLVDAADRIAGDAEEMASRTESQSSSLEESAAALHELTASVSSTAEGAAQAAAAVRRLTETSRRSAETAERASDAVHAIESSAGRISQITKMIDSLAFQTSLLSLNASIEAARAGEAGRGFAVVASEVRTLARRCAEAARDINTLLNESGNHVAAGVGFIGEMSDALREIAQRIGEADDAVSGIAVSAREQAQGLAEINESIAQLEAITQKNTEMVDQSRTASAELRRAAQSLATEMAAFRTTTPTGRDGGIADVA
jgi:methyl-accepting chemotaxis protein